MRKKVWDWILTLCCWREEEEKNAVILLAFVFVAFLAFRTNELRSKSASRREEKRKKGCSKEFLS